MPSPDAAEGQIVLIPIPQKLPPPEEDRRGGHGRSETSNVLTGAERSGCRRPYGRNSRRSTTARPRTLRPSPPVLSWVSARTVVGTLEAAGTEGDGQIAIVLGVVAVAGVRSQASPGTDPRGAVLIAGNAWRNVSRPLDDVDSDDADVSAASACTCPSRLAPIVAAWQIRQERHPPEPLGHDGVVTSAAGWSSKSTTRSVVNAGPSVTVLARCRHRRMMVVERCDGVRSWPWQR